MRQEDKEVDGPDIEHAEERRRQTDLVEEKEDEFYDLDGKPETFVENKQSDTIITVMKTILAGEQIVINDLQLSKRHLTALEALKSAVDAKDSRHSRFVFAEDRRALLEQALAVLQPELATKYGAKEFEQLFDQVGELRVRLEELEDSEEGITEGVFRTFGEEADKGDASDSADKPGPSNDDLDDTKPAAAKKKKPAAKQEADLSLTGPERPVPPKGPSTLTTGPERPEPAKPPTTLLEPERPVPPKGPTTVGDPKEIAAAAASVPRWRRSGG